MAPQFALFVHIFLMNYKFQGGDLFMKKIEN